jgi:hypothetical protein
MSRSSRPALLRFRTITAAVCMGLLAAGGIAGTASADEFGQANTTSGRIPDNDRHWYCYTGVWSHQWQGIVSTAMENLDAQTSYTSYQEPDGQCRAATDVTFILDSTIDARGTATCTKRTGSLCDKATVRLNQTLLTDYHQRLKTTCHEIGHTVGLAHGSDRTTFWNDCMLSGTAPAGAQYERYNAHHVAHINSRTPDES